MLADGALVGKTDQMMRPILLLGQKSLCMSRRLTGIWSNPNALGKLALDLHIHHI